MLNLKTLRKSRGLSQTDIANQIGVSLRTVQYWENGKRDISFTNIQKLRNVLGDELITQLSSTHEHSNKALVPINKNTSIEENILANPNITEIALYDIQLIEEKLKNANKRIKILEDLNESYKLEINDLKNELLRFTKGNINTR